MPVRIAAILSLVCFVACLLAGTIFGDNPLETVVLVALQGMAATFVIGYVVGMMAGVIVREKVEAEEAKVRDLIKQQKDALATEAEAQGGVIDVA
ncbi:MAG: hypothetical protein AAF656_09565 [Planctomycetota bacterium]